MFGLWYIFFGFIGIAVISLILLVVAKKLEDYFYYKSRRCFDKDYKKYEIWEGVATPSLVTAVLTGIISLFLLGICIFVPIEAKNEIATFEYQKEFIEVAIEDGNELENIAITQTIIEQNQWLSKAKASLNTYGCFSAYWGQGIEDLEPIKVGRGQEAD